MFDRSRVTLVEGKPGSGKTTLMLQDMRRSDPQDCLGLAFTNAAVGVANERVGDDTFTTIHSLAYRQLKQVENVKVLTSTDMARVYAEVGIPGKPPAVDVYGQPQLGSNIQDHMMLRVKALAAATGLSFKEVIVRYGFLRVGKDAGAVAEYLRRQTVQYQTAKGPELVDFDEMLTGCQPHGQWRNVFIDEAQDLTPRQWELVNGFAENADQVFIYRDVNQSVYRWAGAMPEYLDGALAGHGALERRVLTHSHRCSTAVADLANKLVPRMPDPTHWTGTAERGTVQRISPKDERLLVDWVQRRVAEGKSLLVLALTNSRMEALDAALRRNNVPIGMRKGDAMLEPWAEAAELYLRLRNGEQVMGDDLGPLARFSTRARTVLDMVSVKGKTVNWRYLFGPSISPIEFALDKITKPQLKTVADRISRYGTALARGDLRISTVHACKGDEADAVVLDLSYGAARMKEIEGAPKQMLPGYLNPRDAARQMLYVGVTRAKSDLLLLDEGKESGLLRFYGLQR